MCSLLGFLPNGKVIFVDRPLSILTWNQAIAVESFLEMHGKPGFFLRGQSCAESYKHDEHGEHDYEKDCVS